jgi:hypothetical protein
MESSTEAGATPDPGREAISRPQAPLVEARARLAPEDLERGTWIAVLRADEIPHVVMLQDGVCYSLEHDGNRRYPARKLWRLVETKRIPTLLCELGPWTRGRVADTYAAHARIEGDGDCFLPVRDHCAAGFAAAAACSFPYELLPLLSSAGKLARAGTLHLQEERTGARIVLPTYSREDIRARIAQVRRTLRPQD